MKAKQGWGGAVTGPLVLGGLGLVALLVVAVLQWDEARSLAWSALALAVLTAMTGHRL